jgi:hypothetical protein
VRLSTGSHAVRLGGRGTRTRERGSSRRDAPNGEMARHISALVAAPSQAHTRLSPMGLTRSVPTVGSSSLRIGWHCIMNGRTSNSWSDRTSLPQQRPLPSRERRTSNSWSDRTSLPRQRPLPGRERPLTSVRSPAFRCSRSRPIECEFWKVLSRAP